jgi:hypothetical protein
MGKGSVDNFRQPQDVSVRGSSDGEAPSADTADWDDERSSDEIRADIRRTRDRLDRTIDDLQQRFSSKEIVKGGLDAVREIVGDPVQRGIGLVRDNPLPAAMVGLGLIWLLVNAARNKKESYASDVDITELEYREFEGLGECLQESAL